MSPDRIKALESYTDDELLAEIHKRREEAQQRVAKLCMTTEEQSGKYQRKSEAKAAYWAAWHAYREKNPDATVDEWRKAKTAQKRGKR